MALRYPIMHQMANQVLFQIITTQKSPLQTKEFIELKEKNNHIFSVKEKKMSDKIALIGALSSTGQNILTELFRQNFSGFDIYPLDAHQNCGKRIAFGDSFLETRALDDFDFSKVRLTFLCVSSRLAKYKETALKAGSTIIDCTQTGDETDPCLIPALNPLQNPPPKIICNPNSLSIPLALALHPIQMTVGITQCFVSATLSASEFGETTREALLDQTRSVYTGEISKLPSLFQPPLAFNLILNPDPELLRATENQILNITGIKTSVYALLAPFFQGHFFDLVLTTSKPLSSDLITEIFKNNNTCKICHKIPSLTPLDLTGDPTVYITHSQIDPQNKKCARLCLLYDNMAGGSSFNAVSLAKYLLT